MVHENYWLSPPDNLELTENEIHVWIARLDQPALHIKQLAQILSADEYQRSQRFYFKRDSERFVVCRGVLRVILSIYSGVESDQLQFRYGSHGKPYLSENYCSIQFNLAHSQGLALYAFILGSEIGVDLEYVRYMPDLGEIAARFLSERENSALKQLPEIQRQEAFFHCWTRKEAYIKAIGNGLAYPLDQFDVSLVPGEPARLLSVAGDPEEGSRWLLKELEPASGYIAAIAVKGQSWQFRYWQWRRGE